MDESVPFTHPTINNILGLQYSDADYKKYFDGFMQAQEEKKMRGEVKQVYDWTKLYEKFKTTSIASKIPEVEAYKRRLAQADGGNNLSQAFGNLRF